MDLYPLVDKEACSTKLQAKRKDDVIAELAELAAKSEKVGGLSADAIYNSIAERESQGSTGFGNEIAVPHARIPEMDSFLVFLAVSRKGVDFDAIDKKKVRLFIVILGPASEVNTHLQILAFVSRAISHANVKQELLHARSEDVLYESFLRNASPAEGRRQANEPQKLMMVNLYVDEYLYQVLELFIEEGIEGATVIESGGMGQYISNVPLFADFIGFMQQSKHSSKTILSLVPESLVDDLMDRIEEITGDLEKKQGAMVMVLDVLKFRGSMAML